MTEIPSKGPLEEVANDPLLDFSFIGGEYAEPDAAIISDIRQMTGLKSLRTIELVMYAVELAGLIDSEKELELQATELFDVTQQPQDDLVDRKEQKIELSLQEKESRRSAVRDAVTEATNERPDIWPSDFNEIRRISAPATAKNTPVLKIIEAMGSQHKHATKGVVIDASIFDPEPEDCEDVIRILIAKQFSREESGHNGNGDSIGEASA